MPAGNFAPNGAGAGKGKVHVIKAATLKELLVKTIFNPLDFQISETPENRNISLKDRERSPRGKNLNIHILTQREDSISGIVENIPVSVTTLFFRKPHGGYVGFLDQEFPDNEESWVNYCEEIGEAEPPGALKILKISLMEAIS